MIENEENKHIYTHLQIPINQFSIVFIELMSIFLPDEITQLT